MRSASPLDDPVNDVASVTRLVIVLGLLAATLGLAACGSDDADADAVVGSGVRVSEERQVDAFVRVENRTFADVTIMVGEAQSLTVEVEDNVLGLLTTEVTDEQLVLATKRNVKIDQGVGVTISLPALGRVTLTGAGQFRVAGLTDSTFEVVMNGAGNVEATEMVDRVDVTLIGAGNALLSGLVAKVADVSINGAGTAIVHATDSLSASVNGVGSVVYTGDPEEVVTSTSGMGTITKG